MNRGATKSDPVLAVAIVAFLALLSWYAWGQFGPGSGVLTVNSLAAPNYVVDSVAISADGTRMATLHQQNLDQTGPFVIDVRDVQSEQQISSLTMPRAAAERNKTGYDMSPKLRFCDGGKYLVAFAPPDRLYMADTRTFTLRDPINFYDLRLTPGGEGPNSLDGPIPEGPAQFDCAASGGVFVLGFSFGDATAIKLFDLDTGKELTDLGGMFKGLFFKGLSQAYQGDGLAISPDGSKVAFGVWQWGEVGGFAVDVVTTEHGQLLKTLFLGDNFRSEHQLAFAGEGTVIIGEPECDGDVKCDPRSLPRNRKLRLWDFATTGAVRNLSQPFHETYRTFGASADGSVVFAYTGDESYCRLCNSHNGELKVHNARFTVWDRASRKVVARSPSLRVENHPCPWLIFMGSCTSYQQVPEMQMSANGKSILAFWPGEGYLPPEKVEGLGELEVYTLR
jgi:hypothetical protein